MCAGDAPALADAAALLIERRWPDLDSLVPFVTPGFFALLEGLMARKGQWTLWVERGGGVQVDQAW